MVSAFLASVGPGQDDWEALGLYLPRALGLLLEAALPQTRALPPALWPSHLLRGLGRDDLGMTYLPALSP